MLLTSENLKDIKLKTMRFKLEKAEAEVNIALLPMSIIAEARSEKEKGEHDPEDFGFRVLQAGVVDDKGKPVFKTIEDYNNLPPALQIEINNAVFEYNGLGTKAEEVIEKN